MWSGISILIWLGFMCSPDWRAEICVDRKGMNLNLTSTITSKPNTQLRRDYFIMQLIVYATFNVRWFCLCVPLKGWQGVDKTGRVSHFNAAHLRLPQGCWVMQSPWTNFPPGDYEQFMLFYLYSYYFIFSTFILWGHKYVLCFNRTLSSFCAVTKMLLHIYLSVEQLT